MNSDTQAHIIIDNGSGNIKCGFSSEETPKSIFYNVISNQTGVVGELNQPDLFRPVQHGIIENWEKMEKVWEHTFSKELHVTSDQRHVLISESPISPKMSKEKTAQIMFENFNVQAIFISLQALLAMYSVGKTTGIIVDSGDDTTSTVPIMDGFSAPYTILKRNFGGRAITNYLISLLAKRGIDFSSYESKKIAQEIKEKECPLFLNGKDSANVTMKGSSYKLPDGSELTLGREVFDCPEAIFSPDVMGKEVPGVHYQVLDTILKCEPSVRREFYSNIILAGGNTLFTGYPDRLAKEVKNLAPVSLSDKVKVIAQSERKYSTWIGGAILAGLGSFQYMWITRGDYQDSGPSVVHRKC